MSEIVEFVQDQTILKLLDTVAKVRNGEIIGVTLVTTNNVGVVSMETLSIPLPGKASRVA